MEWRPLDKQPVTECALLETRYKDHKAVSQESHRAGSLNVLCTAGEAAVCAAAISSVAATCSVAAVISSVTATCSRLLHTDQAGLAQ